MDEEAFRDCNSFESSILRVFTVDRSGCLHKENKRRCTICFSFCHATPSFTQADKTCFSTIFSHVIFDLDHQCRYCFSCQKGFAERAKNMVPYVKETLLFAMQHNSIYVTKAGQLKISHPVPKSFPKATQDVNECVWAAVRCGKLFSMVGDFKTAMALLGVRP